MLKQFAEIALQYLNLARDVLQLKDDLKALRQEVKDLRAEGETTRAQFVSLEKELKKEMAAQTRAIEFLGYELRRTRDHDESERRLLTLQLENELLKFERRLPPPQN